MLGRDRRLIFDPMMDLLAVEWTSEEDRPHRHLVALDAAELVDVGQPAPARGGAESRAQSAAILWSIGLVRLRRARTFSEDRARPIGRSQRPLWRRAP